jgi:hypothetical protein
LITDVGDYIGARRYDGTEMFVGLPLPAAGPLGNVCNQNNFVQ